MDFAPLTSSVAGSVITPLDDRYRQASIFHTGVSSPDVIVIPVAVPDVEKAVRFAANAGMPISVRGGGHSYWGNVPGGMLIDLAGLAEVRVERSGGAALVHIGGGATWGRVAEILSTEFLAISSGDRASVGVGGLTLGGGIGLMVRAWGLAADQLVAAEIVTADGKRRTVDAEREPDLFWALRGGGGGYGVVTEFTFAAHDLDGVVVADVEVTDTRQALVSARDGIRTAPQEVTATFMDVPPMDPSAPAGKTFSIVWAGSDTAAASSAFASLLAAGVVPIQTRTTMYSDVLQQMPPVDPDMPMPGFIGGNVLVAELTDEIIDSLISFRERWPGSVVFARSLGGAFGAVPENATAFGSRSATWFVMAGAFDMGLDDADRTQIRAAWQEIRDRGLTVYGNFSNATDAEAVREMYTPTAAEKLARVKAQWDPANIFSRAHVVTSANV